MALTVNVWVGITHSVIVVPDSYSVVVGSGGAVVVSSTVSVGTVGASVVVVVSITVTVQVPMVHSGVGKMVVAVHPGRPSVQVSVSVIVIGGVVSAVVVSGSVGVTMTETVQVPVVHSSVGETVSGEQSSSGPVQLEVTVVVTGGVSMTETVQVPVVQLGGGRIVVGLHSLGPFVQTEVVVIVIGGSGARVVITGGG